MSDHELPVDARVTYHQQYRRCNKADCPRCRGEGPGHGPYWFAYWREDGRLRSRYLGRTLPAAAAQSLPTGPGGTAQASDGAAGAGVPAATTDPVASATVPATQVRTLGGFALWSGEQQIPVAAWQARKTLTLFTCLLSAPHQRAHRDSLLDLLWPEMPPETGPRNLRLVVYRLRQLLQAQASGLDCARTGEALQLVSRTGQPAAAWLDAVAFEQAARAALAGQDLAACRAALARYSGEYLPEERYADWALARREELRHLYLAVLLHLARLRERSGILGEAVRCLRRVLALDPCHEHAAQSLMRLLARSGRRTEAVRVYQQVATALERDLQLQPERHTQDLYRTLTERETTPLPRTTLPTPLTSFIGREQDLATLTVALTAAAAPAAGHARPRLVTLAGPGGCGKTRLAIELGHELLAAYAQGVWYVDLAPIRSTVGAAPPEDAAGQVSHAVARALELREDPGCSLLDTVVQALRDRHALLILDNCEHLVAACVTVVATLLTRCPRLTVLATSREALALQGEILWRVQPLAVPGPATSGDVEALASFPALRLFEERARAVRPAFTLDPRTLPAVAEICRRLDGVPLAIELAAACLGSLSVHEVAARLDDRFRLLVTGNRAAAPRHQTLQATLEWSYSLLNDAEQTVLRRLAAFGAGGWTLAAAEAVLEADGAVDAPAVLPLLRQLVAKSLVQQTDDLEESRFGLLETVWRYSWERLSPAEREAVQARTWPGACRWPSRPSRS